MQVIDTMYRVGVLFSQPKDFYTDSIIDMIEQKHDTPENILCDTSGDYSLLVKNNFDIENKTRAFKFAIRTENIEACGLLVKCIANNSIKYEKSISLPVLEVVINKLKKVDASIFKNYKTVPNLEVFEYICKNKINTECKWKLTNPHVLLATTYNCREHYDLGPNPFTVNCFTKIKNLDERNDLGQNPFMYYLSKGNDSCEYLCRNKSSLNAKDNFGKSVVFYLLDYNPNLVKIYADSIDFNVTYLGDTPLTYTKLSLDVALKIKCNPNVINNGRHVLTMCPDYPLDNIDLSIIGPIFENIIDVQPIYSIRNIYMFFENKMTRKQKICFVKKLLVNRNTAITNATSFNYYENEKSTGIKRLLHIYHNTIVAKSNFNFSSDIKSDCCVCMENKSKFPLECDHDICVDCVVKIENDRCPICRQSLLNPHGKLCF